jgi:BirA family biotin operon repressor/biotin-[acetyl-CoA-carboxylase] ligase
MAPDLGLQTQLDWGAEALQRQLQPLWPGMCVELLAQCGSTNSLLIERAREADGDFQPCLLVAERQTQGRGRLGRGWVSAAGASLTFSIAVPLAPRDWAGLSLAVGLALAEALDPSTLAASQPALAPDAAAPRIGLKWPNDLWLTDAEGRDAPGGLAGTRAPGAAAGGRKLGGILIETVGAAAGRVCVVGVGLNVQPLPASLANGLATACLEEMNGGASAPAVLAHVAAPLVGALQAFERDGFAPLEHRFARRDVLCGHEVKTSLANPGAGVAEGVDATGALVLRSGGERHRIVSGEVSVRRAATEPAR